MRVVNVEVFKFDELEPGIQRRVLTHFLEIYSFESDFLTNDFHTVLEEKGFTNVECFWNLSNCQGDGVAFYGKPDFHELCSKYEQLEKIKKEIEEKMESYGVYIEISDRGYRSHHWNSMSVDIEIEGDFRQEGLDFNSDNEKQLEKWADSIREFLADEVKNISRELEKMGYAEIEYHYSDENIKEFIHANEYQFLRNGDIFHE